MTLAACTNGQQPAHRVGQLDQEGVAPLVREQVRSGSHDRLWPHGGLDPRSQGVQMIQKRLCVFRNDTGQQSIQQKQTLMSGAFKCKSGICDYDGEAATTTNVDNFSCTSLMMWQLLRLLLSNTQHCNYHRLCHYQKNWRSCIQN